MYFFFLIRPIRLIQDFILNLQAWNNFQIQKPPNDTNVFACPLLPLEFPEKNIGNISEMLILHFKRQKTFYTLICFRYSTSNRNIFKGSLFFRVCFFFFFEWAFTIIFQRNWKLHKSRIIWQIINIAETLWGLSFVFFFREFSSHLLP